MPCALKCGRLPCGSLAAQSVPLCGFVLRIWSTGSAQVARQRVTLCRAAGRKQRIDSVSDMPSKFADKTKENSFPLSPALGLRGFALATSMKEA